MKTLFSSQDDIFTKFNGILIYVWIVWKSVFFYLNRRHTLSTNNRTPELHVPQISKVKFAVNKSKIWKIIND